LLVLGMATKPVLFPFGLFTIFLSFLLFIIERKRTFLLAAIIPVLWISFYSEWNYERTGSVQYSSIQTANMINYNLRYYLVGQKGDDYATATIDQLYKECGSEATYTMKVGCLNSGVKNVIREAPLKYGLFHLKGCIRYFLDPGRFDLVSFFNLEKADSTGFLHTINKEGIPGAFNFLKSQGWGLILILAFIGLFKVVKITGFLLYLFRKNEQLQLRIFLFMLVAYLALATGPLGASRFLLPVELLIIGGSLQGWIPLVVKLRLKN